MKKYILSLAALLVFSYNVCSDELRIQLNGKWELSLDPKDKGIEEKWYNKRLNDEVCLPGSLTTNGKGYDIDLQTPWTGQIVDSSWFKADKYAKYRDPDNLKIPAWLQPNKYYKGAAWYSRNFIVTQEMSGKELEIVFERVHWESSLWIDSLFIETQNSLGVPHRYILPALEKGEHRITVMIDNRIKNVNVGHNAHSVSDHTQSNWNGIVGDMYVRTVDGITIENIVLYPDINKNVVRAQVVTNNRCSENKKINLNVSVESKYTPTLHKPDPVDYSFNVNRGVDTVTFEYAMGDKYYSWSEFTPYVYDMNIDMDGESISYSKSVQFGMRNLKIDGKKILLNDRHIFLRGTLECAIFPKTGYPAMDELEWVRIFEICKAHGLNHVRFHSWCPPHAAFYAADRLGVYLQVEGGGWCSVGDGGDFDRWIYEESDRIINEYGNHPSFMFYTYGNEPSGGNQAKFLGDLVTYLKKRDSRHLYTSAAGWPMIEQNEYRNDMYPRLKVWGELSPLNDRPRYDHNFDKMVSQCSIPWISHEIGQWCVYPDFKEIASYDGCVLKAKNFEIFRETLAENGLSQYAEQFLLASGKLQTILYKAEIEAALRTKDFAGFQLLDLHDFPGQGTALVGVLNPFWESKGYITPQEYHSFSSAVVPLIRTDKVIYKADEMFNVEVEIANFGEKQIENSVPNWILRRADGSIYATGNFPLQNINIGNNIRLGSIQKKLIDIDKPEKLTLSVTVSDYSNKWDFWVYPDKTVKNADIKIVDKIDDNIINDVKNGASVIIMPKDGAIKPEFGGNIQSGFTTIFWNSAWTAGNQPPLTLGLLIENKHPLFSNFPTDFHSNYQWYDIVTNPNIINLTALKSDIKPIVRVIDDWFENRSLALIFEAKLGKGKFIYVGKDLKGDGSTPVTNALYNSIVEYMNSSDFNPQTHISPNELKQIFR